MEFDTTYSYTKPVLELYGTIDDYIIVRISDDKVQIRKVVKDE